MLEGKNGSDLSRCNYTAAQGEEGREKGAPCGAAAGCRGAVTPRSTPRGSWPRAAHGLGPEPRRVTVCPPTGFCPGCFAHSRGAVRAAAPPIAAGAARGAPGAAQLPAVPSCSLCSARPGGCWKRFGRQTPKKAPQKAPAATAGVLQRRCAGRGQRLREGQGEVKTGGAETPASTTTAPGGCWGPGGAPGALFSLPCPADGFRAGAGLSGCDQAGAAAWPRFVPEK